jgi:hypothetical protein
MSFGLRKFHAAEVAGGDTEKTADVLVDQGRSRGGLTLMISIR